MVNDIERQTFWTTEVNQDLGVMCVHCGSRNTRLEDDLVYDDGADEPNTSNHLVTVYYYVCKDCGDITNTHDYKTKGA